MYTFTAKRRQGTFAIRLDPKRLLLDAERSRFRWIRRFRWPNLFWIYTHGGHADVKATDKYMENTENAMYI